MTDEPVVIPEKIYFKIGEVCELVGVQAHVLRYWETEFPMLSPQKNKSGQRSYRRRDVEMALKIKELLYKQMFTIAGARKKLQSDHRDGRSKMPSEPPPTESRASSDAPMLFDIQPEVETGNGAAGDMGDLNTRQREALKTLAHHLLELRELLGRKPEA
jgi:DNA-binding transcriptional MerR regulator